MGEVVARPLFLVGPLCSETFTYLQITPCSWYNFLVTSFLSSWASFLLVVSWKESAVAMRLCSRVSSYHIWLLQQQSQNPWDISVSFFWGCNWPLYMPVEQALGECLLFCSLSWTHMPPSQGFTRCLISPHPNPLMGCFPQSSYLLCLIQHSIPTSKFALAFMLYFTI